MHTADAYMHDANKTQFNNNINMDTTQPTHIGEGPTPVQVAVQEFFN